MAESSPRATKRRRVESPQPSEHDSMVTSLSAKRPTPRTYSKRGRNASRNGEDKENDVRSTRSFRHPSSYLSANHHQTIQQGQLPDKTGNAPIATMTNTPSQEHAGSRDVGRQAMAGLDDVTARTSKEDAADATIEPQSATGARSSGRRRKQTWKLTPTEPATPTRRPKKSPKPASLSEKHAVSNLSPLAKDHVSEEATTTPASVAEAVLNAVSTLAATPTPTPKKGPQSKNTKSQKSANDDSPLVTPTPLKNKSPAKARKPAVKPTRASLEATSNNAPSPIVPPPIADDALMMEPSPFKTVAPDLTPTPRKRGRPPKARVVDEFGFSAIDPLGTTSKRQRTSLAQETEDIDPLAAFVRRDFASAKKLSSAHTETAKAVPVSWQEYKEQGPTIVARPDCSTSFANLQQLVQDETFYGPLADLRARILRSLTGKEKTPIRGLDDEYRKVHHVLEQTVIAGEGNSMLVIGPRGSGKSALVESAIRGITLHHANDFHVIRLNGFVHTDDKLALREIWRQLGREMEVDDGSMLERSNYADTLSSLLAVLSHPTEQLENQQEGAQPEGQISKSVIFIIDEFDLFTSHARQTLLYNLFDIAQARKAPIAVLGLTTRVDVTECLEKRVKSRFSHRSVFLSRPKSFFAFQQICLAALEAYRDPLDTTARDKMGDATTIDADGALRDAWCDYMTSLFHESTSLTATLRTIYATSRSIAVALSAFLLPMSTLSPSRIPTDADFANQALLAPDSKLNLIHSLTDLELALLISAARLDIILNVDTCNFNMAYDEYTTLADKTRLQTSASGALALGNVARFWSREAALGAWEKLEILELIMPLATAGYGAGAGLADVGRAGKLMRCDVSLEEIGACGADMNGTMKKWCKEI